MNLPSEDELIETLTWSSESYTLVELMDQHQLPQVVRVERGYDGGQDGVALGHAEILTLHCVRETTILAAEDSNGNAMVIARECPWKVLILPHVEDCSLSWCTIGDIPSIFPKVIYLEVLQAHYGDGDEDSTSVGEILEVVSIEKRTKVIKVKNVKSDQTVSLSPECTAYFRPLLDWRNRNVTEIKSHFGFPTRVQFLVPNDDNKQAGYRECLQLASKTQAVTILGEMNEVLVIGTPAGNCADLKCSYEIPKHLEVKLTVAKELLNGDKHYQDVVTSLDKGFDWLKLISTCQPLVFKRRDSIRQHSYEEIKNLFFDISREPSNVNKKEEEQPPVLPPRRPQSATKSVPLISPEVSQRTKGVPPSAATLPKPSPTPRSSKPTENSISKPLAVPPVKPRANRSPSESPEVRRPEVLARSRNVPDVPSKPKPALLPRRDRSDSAPSSTAPASESPSEDGALGLSAEGKAEDTRPSQTFSRKPRPVAALISPRLCRRNLPEDAWKVLPIVSETQERKHDEPARPEESETIPPESQSQPKKAPEGAWKVLPGSSEVPQPSPIDPKNPRGSPSARPSKSPLEAPKESWPSQPKLPSSPPDTPNVPESPPAESDKKRSLNVPNFFKNVNIKGIKKEKAKETDSSDLKQPTATADEATRSCEPSVQAKPKTPKIPKKTSDGSRKPLPASAEAPQCPPIPLTPPPLLKPPSSSAIILSHNPKSTSFPQLPPNVPDNPKQTSQTLSKEASVKAREHDDDTDLEDESMYEEVNGIVKPSSRKTSGNTYKTCENTYEELLPAETSSPEHIYTPFGLQQEKSNADKKAKSVENMNSSQVPEGIDWETEDPYAVIMRIPEDLSGLSITNVSTILKNLGMECYIEKFRKEMIDGDLLKSLREDDLISLSVNVFHAKKLAKFINGWRPRQ